MFVAVLCVGLAVPVTAPGEEPLSQLPAGTYVFETGRAYGTNTVVTAIKNPRLMDLGGLRFLVGTVDSRYASSIDRTEYGGKQAWLPFNMVTRFHRME